MAVSYGTYTITEVQEGSQIWTSSAAPTTPNYTFDVSKLVGDSETSIKSGDIIMHSYNRYTVLSVSSDGKTVLAGNLQSIRGATGAASVTYALIVSNLAIVKDKNGNLSPSTITVTAKSQTGSNAMANYTGRIKIETTTDNSTWTSRINEDAATKTYTIPSDTVAIRCSLYLKGGTTTLLDQQTVPVVSDGINGTNGKDGVDGKDAYSIVLTNENHTFAGNTTSALASEIECNVIAYKGTTQIAATIGTITGQPTGMTTSLLNNGTVNVAFRVSVTSSMVTKNGVLNVPITVDNKVFTKKFTYGLALDGEDGKDGGRWYSGTSITGTSTTASVFSGSGISSAVEGDMYLNTSTYNTYRCTLGGDASTAKWVYVNNIKGVHGDTGKGVSSITNQYYLSTSNTTQTGGSWSSTVPPYVEDCYYWTKSHIVWTDNTETDTTAVLDNGLTDANANAIDARKVATNYLAVDKTGIMVANMENGEQTPSGISSGNNVFIDSASVNIREGQNILASFGVDGMQIGLDNETRTEQDYHSWKMVDKDDNVYAFVSDLRDEYGEATVTETAKINEATNWVETNFEISSIISVTVNGEEPESYQKRLPKLIDITPEPTDEDVVVVTYTSQSSELKAYTFGKRAQDSNIGGYSFAEGTDNVASGSASHVEGVINVASGHASHAEGVGTTASGDYSHAQNFYTTASSSWQTVVGRHNVDDTNNKYAFIVGNGHRNQGIHKVDYANALGITWDGTMEIGGLMCGTLVENSEPAKILPTRTPIPLFKTVSWSGNSSDNWDNQTIGYNSGWSRSGFNIYQKGYRALGVVGFGVYNASSNSSNVDWCVVTRCYTWYNPNIITDDNHIGADTLDIYVWNQHQSQSAKVRVFARVLYIAESALIGVVEPGTPV